MYLSIISFKGEYEMVISDYGRAKSLFAETDIKIFKKGTVQKWVVMVVVMLNAIS